MVKIIKTAQAGSLESGDILLTVAPGPAGSGIIIKLDSIVLARYGEAIRNTLTATAVDQGVADVYLTAVDRGALDCTIRARLLTALARAGVVLKEDMV